MNSIMWDNCKVYSICFSCKSLNRPAYVCDLITICILPLRFQYICYWTFKINTSLFHNNFTWLHPISFISLNKFHHIIHRYRKKVIYSCEKNFFLLKMDLSFFLWKYEFMKGGVYRLRIIRVYETNVENSRLKCMEKFILNLRYMCLNLFWQKVFLLFEWQKFNTQIYLKELNLKYLSPIIKNKHRL